MRRAPFICRGCLNDGVRARRYVRDCAGCREGDRRRRAKRFAAAVRATQKAAATRPTGQLPLSL